MYSFNPIMVDSYGSFLIAKRPPAIRLYDGTNLNHPLEGLHVIDKPWLLSRFWVYCKLYHSLVTFHCLTPNEAEPSLGQAVKGHQIII